MLELYEEILRALPVAVYAVNAQTRQLQFVGGAVEAITGYTLQEYRANTTIAKDILHPDDRERVVEQYRAGLQAGKPFELQFRITHRDGRTLWLTTRVLPSLDSSGRMHRRIGLTSDITAQRQAEAHLRSEQRLLNSIIDENPYSIGITDREGRFIRHNRAFFELFRSLPPPGYTLFADPLAIEAGQTPFFDALRQGSAIHPEAIWYDPHRVDPSLPKWRRCLRLTAFPILDEAHELQNVVVMHEDVTEQRLAQDRVSRRRALLEVIAEAAQLFMRTAEWESTVPDVLAMSGRAAGVSRAYLFERIAGSSLRCMSFWAAEDTLSPLQEDLLRPSVGEGPFARWNDVLMAGQTIHGRPEDFTSDEAEALASRGVKSVLQIPVFVDEQWFGFIGFDDCLACRDWSEGEVDVLRTLAGLLGNTIRRTRIERALQQTNEMLESRVAERTADLVALNKELEREIAERRQAEETLQASEARLGAFVHTMPDVAFILDEDGRYLDVLANNQSLLYDRVVHLKGRLLHEVFPAEQADVFVEVIRRTLDSNSVQNHEYEIEVPLGCRWFEARTAPLLSAESPRRQVVWVARDVTQRKRDTEALARLSRAIENAGEGIGMLDRQLRLTYANPQLSRIFGQSSPESMIGLCWDDLFVAGEKSEQAAVRSALRKRDRWTGRMRGRDTQGQIVPLGVTVARVPLPHGDWLLVLNLRDQSVEELHLVQVRKLTLDAANSLEQERARLSRELHDELGQILTAINLDLAWLSARSDPWGRPAQERLVGTKQLVNQMLEAVRSLSTSLRPPILDNRGLLEAIRSYSKQLAKRAGFSCRVVAYPSDLEVPDPLATTVFRIIQEALTNVARHSNASRCGVFLRLSDSVLELKIRDNGVGAVPSRLDGVQSLGIAGMKERAAAVGGVLKAENRSEGGVCVMARLPWQHRETERT